MSSFLLSLLIGALAGTVVVVKDARGPVAGALVIVYVDDPSEPPRILDPTGKDGRVEVGNLDPKLAFIDVYAEHQSQTGMKTVQRDAEGKFPNEIMIQLTDKDAERSGHRPDAASIVELQQ